MGIDVQFNVYCRKVSTMNYVFTTATPWKEAKELAKQGYTVVRSTSTDITLQKVEHAEDAPFISHYGRLQRFEDLQGLFKQHYDPYKQWCKWDFERCNSLTSREDIVSALAVWDDLWEDILAAIGEGDADFANMVCSKMREILQYAVDNEGIHVLTDYRIDY